MIKHSLIDLCRRYGLTVSAAESLTGGLVSAMFTHESGSSKVFIGGIVAYHIDVKVNLLGVNRREAETCDCVSENVAMTMAKAVASLLKTDIGVATTGFADGDNQHAWIAVYHDGVTRTDLVMPREDKTREEMRTLVVERLENLIRKTISGIQYE